MSAVKYKLYGTQYCHLCDEAEIILREIGIAFDYVDIAEDDDLVERYGTRIPVLQRADNHAELGWPFNVQEVIAWNKISHI